MKKKTLRNCQCDNCEFWKLKLEEQNTQSVALMNIVMTRHCLKLKANKDVPVLGKKKDIDSQ